MNQINILLQELYDIEPSLRNNEKEALEIVNALLSIKPKIEVSEAFKKRLRNQLMVEIEKRKSRQFDIKNFFKVGSSIFAGAMVTYAAFQFFVVPWVTPQDSIKVPMHGETPDAKMAELWAQKDMAMSQMWWEEPKKQTLQENSAIPTPPKTSEVSSPQTPHTPTQEMAMISDTSEISAPAQPTTKQTPQTEAPTSPIVDTSVTDVVENMARDIDQEIANISSSNSDAQTPDEDTSTQEDAPRVSKMAPQEMILQDSFWATSFAPMVEYSYVYSGNMMPEYGEQAQIYTIERAPVSQDEVDTLKKSAGEDSYDVYQDTYSNTVSVSQKYRPEDYAQVQMLHKEDMPSKEEVQKVSDAFLQTLAIDTKNYAEAVVPYDWEKEYEQTQDKQNFYFADTISLVYPEKVEDTAVYDESWYPTGLNVSVNVAKKKVTYVGPIQKQTYVAQTRDTRSNPEILESLNMQGHIPDAPKETKKVQVEVGKAKVRYTKYYNYEGKDQEVIVPTVVFEVLEKPEWYYGPESVAIPLVK